MVFFVQTPAISPSSYKTNLGNWAAVICLAVNFRSLWKQDVNRFLWSRVVTHILEKQCHSNSSLKNTVAHHQRLYHVVWTCSMGLLRLTSLVCDCSGHSGLEPASAHAFAVSLCVYLFFLVCSCTHTYTWYTCVPWCEYGNQRATGFSYGSQGQLRLSGLTAAIFSPEPSCWSLPCFLERV